MMTKRMHCKNHVTRFRKALDDTGPAPPCSARLLLWSSRAFGNPSGGVWGYVALRAGVLQRKRRSASEAILCGRLVLAFVFFFFCVWHDSANRLTNEMTDVRLNSAKLCKSLGKSCKSRPPPADKYAK